MPTIHHPSSLKLFRLNNFIRKWLFALGDDKCVSSVLSGVKMMPKIDYRIRSHPLNYYCKKLRVVASIYSEMMRHTTKKIIRCKNISQLVVTHCVYPTVYFLYNVTDLTISQMINSSLFSLILFTCGIILK